MEREYLRRKAAPVDYFDAEESGDEHEGYVDMAEDDQVDPLDAFMQGIDAQVTQQRMASPKRAIEKPQVLNFDQEDADGYFEKNAMV